MFIDFTAHCTHYHSSYCVCVCASVYWVKLWSCLPKILAGSCWLVYQIPPPPTHHTPHIHVHITYVASPQCAPVCPERATHCANEYCSTRTRAVVILYTCSLIINVSYAYSLIHHHVHAHHTHHLGKELPHVLLHVCWTAKGEVRTAPTQGMYNNIILAKLGQDLGFSATKGMHFPFSKLLIHSREFYGVWIIT